MGRTPANATATAPGRPNQRLPNRFTGQKTPTGIIALRVVPEGNM
jgi:hypothetical protein